MKTPGISGKCCRDADICDDDFVLNLPLGSTDQRTSVIISHFDENIPCFDSSSDRESQMYLLVSLVFMLMPK